MNQTPGPPPHLPRPGPPGPNGRPAKPKPVPGPERIGQAVAQALTPVILQSAQAQAQLTAQLIAQGRQRLACRPCLTARIRWNLAHTDELEAAREAAVRAAGFPEGDPRSAQIDVTPHLPAELRPGGGEQAMPPMVNGPLTMADGNLVCPQHLPGIEVKPGRKNFLIAHGHLTPGMLAGLGQPA